MSKEEMKKRIEELEEREFLYNMVDRWSNEDRKAMNEIQKEIRILRRNLAN